MRSIQSLLEQAKSDENHSSVSHSEIEFKKQAEAAQAFSEYKEKLLIVDCWNEAGEISSYTLFNQKGEKLKSRTIAENSLIRISLKGTGKYDWVKVVEIADNKHEMILTVQPTFDATAQESKKNRVSHFFTDEARNNFCLQLDNKKINFYIIGLNEKQNVTHTNDFVEAIRNWVTANIGSYLGIQKGEWKIFAKNFLQSQNQK